MEQSEFRPAQHLMHFPICLLKAVLKREDCSFEKGRQDKYSQLQHRSDESQPKERESHEACFMAYSNMKK